MPVFTEFDAKPAFPACVDAAKLREADFHPLYTWSQQALSEEEMAESLKIGTCLGQRLHAGVSCDSNQGISTRILG